ncbi:dynein heavy chain [Thraustotheca clavata]|uniref:Dynein heavy chain n=1 Tax=Thraustotheca clavata TaxID=74557 RepID=A0A1V9ZQ10_9STRA|nr:dynein heavy chain [Thraustotheca clavata]
MERKGSSSRSARMSARREIEQTSLKDDGYTESNQWIDAEEYHRMSKIVANEKEAEYRNAHAILPMKHMKQTWHTPLHVPLGKLKQANLSLPEGIKPVAPAPPQSCAPRNTSRRTMRLKEESEANDHRELISRLKSENKELYNKLSTRFRQQRNSRLSPVKSSISVTTVEDAILYFISEKHRRNVLYYHLENNSKSLSFRPYDIKRVPTLAHTSREEHYLLSATHMVHCKPNDHAEVIPISEWVYHSKMFDHLLRSIPLFQQLLRRRIFAKWSAYVNRSIFQKMRQKLVSRLCFARPNYTAAILHLADISSMIQSYRALRLSDDDNKGSMSLIDWSNLQSNRLRDIEAQLVEAKAIAHRALEVLVQSIRIASTPDTTLEELNAVDMYEMRQAYPDWKSIPMVRMKTFKKDKVAQIKQAKADLLYLPTFFRLLQYIYLESLFGMVTASTESLHFEFSQPQSASTITVAVSFLAEQGSVVLFEPSENDVLLQTSESITKLITLANSFCSNRPLQSYLTSEEATTCITTDLPSSMLKLTEVIQASSKFQSVTCALQATIQDTFTRVASQVTQFEGLRPIYGSMQTLSEALPLLDSSTYMTEMPSLLAAISKKIGLLDAWQSQCYRIQSSWNIGFVEVHCRHILMEVMDKICAQRATADELLQCIANRGITECVTKLKDAIALFDERPQLIQAFCQQKKATRLLLDKEGELLQDMAMVDDAFRVLKNLSPNAATNCLSQYNMIHASYAKYTLSQQANVKFSKKMVPQIAKQILAALQKLTFQCKRIMNQLEINLTVVNAQSVMASGKIDFESKLRPLAEIKVELDRISEAAVLYYEYQNVLSMKVTPISNLQAALSFYNEVHEVWAVSQEWKISVHSMQNSKFLTQSWLSHLDTIKGFHARADQVRCRYENKIFNGIKGEIAYFLKQLDLLVELGSSYIKTTHWEQIFKVLGCSLSIGTMTLKQLNDANLWSNVDKIKIITYHARVDAETEAILQKMKARWAATQLQCADLELDSSIVDELLIALDDDLVQVQLLMQKTSQSSLYQALALWSDEINYIQDTLELWISTQADWLKLDRLFQLPDVQSNVRHGNVEFQAISRKWKAMMKGVRTTTSIKQCVREVTNRAFLADTKQLFERLWKQLVLFLQEKRREFPRFNFLSDRDILSIMAGTTLSLRDPSNLPASQSHLSEVIGICFEHLKFTTVRIQMTNFNSLLGESIGGEHLLDSTNLITDMQPVEDQYTTDITAVHGSHDEILELSSAVRVTHRPEFWMHELHKSIQRAMRECIRMTIAQEGGNPVLHSYIKDGNGNMCQFKKSYAILVSMDSVIAKSEELIQSWPLQVLLLAFRIYFTGDCCRFIQDEYDLSTYKSYRDQQLYKAKMWITTMQKTSSTQTRLACATLSLNFLNNIHALERLHDSDNRSFMWSQMLQYQWALDNQTVQICQGLKKYDYGFEYLGPHSTIALTPLTERIMWNISTAFRLYAGALVYGETGVSKQATIRELVTCLGALCVVYDCSIQLNIGQLSRILGGIVQCQAYAMVVGLENVATNSFENFLHQIKRLQHALKTLKDKVILDNMSIGIHSHDRSSINFGVCCKLTLSDPNCDVVNMYTRSFVPIAASFQMVDVIVLAQIYLTCHGFEQVNNLSHELHSFLLIHEAGYGKSKGEQVTVRTVKKILDLACTFRNLFSEEGHVLAYAIMHAIGSRISTTRKRVFLQQLHASFPTFHHVELDITKTQSRIQESIQANHRISTPILSKKVYELYHMCAKYTINVITGEVATGKSTIIDILSGIRKSHSSQSSEFPKCYRIAAATLKTFEFYGQFSPHNNEWIDGILTHYVHQKASRDRRQPWLIFDGDMASACIEPLYAITDDSSYVHLPNGERLDTSKVKIFFETCTLEAWSPAALNRFGVMFVPSDSLPYTVFIKSWVLSIESSIGIRGDKRIFKAAKVISQLMRSHLPSLLEVCKNHWQTHLSFHAPTYVLKLIQILNNFFEQLTTGDSTTLEKDMVLVYLFACTWSLGAYIDIEARQLFHDTLIEIAPELMHHRLFTSGRTVYDIYLHCEKQNVALVTWQSKLEKMDWAGMTYHSYVFVPNATSVCVEHMMEYFAASKQHALVIGNRGSGKSSCAKRSMNQLIKRNFVAKTIYVERSMESRVLQESIMADLERKMKGLYGPGIGKHAMVYFVEDLHLGSIACQEQFRQVFDTKGIYHRRTFEFIELQHHSIICFASTHPQEAVSVPHRLLRHLHVIWIPPVSPDALFKMFQSLPQHMVDHFTPRFNVENIWRILQFPLIVFELLMQEDFESFFAQFPLGDLVLIYSHVFRASRSNFETKSHFEALVYNVTVNVLSPKASGTLNGVQYFGKVLPPIATTLDFELVSYNNRPLYGDKSDGFGYVQLSSKEATSLFIKGHEKFQWHHPTFQNSLVKNLAPFPEAIDAMLAVLFGLSDLRQHLILLGPRGCGKRTSTVVVCGILSYNYVEIRTSAGFFTHIKEILLHVGIHAKHTVLYVAVDQLEFTMVQSILNLIRGGELPTNLFSPEDIDIITEGIAQLPSMCNTSPSKSQCIDHYRRNLNAFLHVAFSMGCDDRLHSMLDYFGSLLEFSTLHNFKPWAPSAFVIIYEHMNVLPPLQQVVWQIHKSFLKLSSKSSTNTTEQYKTFVMGLSVYHIERTKAIQDMRAQYSQGLKMMSQHTSTIKALGSSERILAKRLRTLSAKSEQINSRYEKFVAIEQEARIAFEEKDQSYQLVKKKLDEERFLIQFELDQTIPELQTAIQSLSKINKLHITEMKSFTSPPDLVRLVMQAVCILLGLGAAPTWEDALFVLCDMKFLDRLRTFDKNNIPDAVMRKLDKVLQHPKFNEEEMKRASIASTSLCQWVLALARYHRVMTVVRPKQSTIDSAERDLDRVKREVDVVRDGWSSHVTQVNQLQLAWHENEAMKMQIKHDYDELIKRVQSLERVNHAFEVFKSLLRKENHRIQSLEQASLGDSVLLTAMSTYVAGIAPSDRMPFIEAWTTDLNQAKIHHSANLIEAMTGAEGLQELRTSCNIADPGIYMNLYYMSRWKMLKQARTQHMLLFDPHGIAILWIKTVERLTLEVVSANDPMLLARFEMSPPNPNYILLVDRVAECEESVLWDFISLLRMKKIRHPVYFIADYNCTANWSIELVEMFVTLNFELKADILQLYIVALFFSRFFPADDNHLHALNEALLEDMRHRSLTIKSLLRQLNNPFLLSSDDEVTQLASQMDELVLVNASIESKQKDIQAIEAIRDNHAEIGQRGRALMDATSAFGFEQRCRSIHLIEDGINHLQEPMPGADVGDICHQLTVRFLQDVLHGLPEQFHVPFTFFVALAIAATEYNCKPLVQLCWIKLEEQKLHCTPGIHLPIDVFLSSPTLTHKAATQVVENAILRCARKLIAKCENVSDTPKLSFEAILSGKARLWYSKTGQKHSYAIVRLLNKAEDLLAIDMFKPLLDDIDNNIELYESFMQSKPHFLQDVPRTKFMNSLPAVAKLMFIALCHDIIIPNMMQQVVNAYVPEINYEVVTIPVIAQITDCHQPILMQYDCKKLVHPLWCIIEAAQSIGIRDADIWYFSFSTPDIIGATLRALKDASVHGGWLILQDFVHISPSDLVDLSRQFEAMANGDMSLHTDFRVWLIDESPSSLLYRLPMIRLRAFFFNISFKMQSHWRNLSSPYQYGLQYFHSIVLAGHEFGGVHTASPFSCRLSQYELEKAEYLLELLDDKRDKFKASEVAMLIAPLYQGKSIDPSINIQFQTLLQWIFELSVGAPNRPNMGEWFCRLQRSTQAYSSQRQALIREGLRRSCDVLIPMDMGMTAVMMGLPNLLDTYFDTMTMVSIATTLTLSRTHSKPNFRPLNSRFDDVLDALALQIPSDNVFLHTHHRKKLQDHIKNQSFPTLLHEVLTLELYEMESLLTLIWHDLRATSATIELTLLQGQVPEEWLSRGYSCPRSLVKFITWLQSSVSYYLEFLFTFQVQVLYLQAFQNPHGVLFKLLHAHSIVSNTSVCDLCLGVCLSDNVANSANLTHIFLRNAKWCNEKLELCELNIDDLLIQPSTNLRITPLSRSEISSLGWFPCPVYSYYSTSQSTLATPIVFHIYIPISHDVSNYYAKAVAIVLNESS